MKLVLLFFVFALAPALFAEDREVKTVSHVDLKKYLGKWYEIARYPNGFQKDCAGQVTATYTEREDGKIAVLNECRKKDGKIKAAKGKAKVDDPKTNSKLRVTFFWPFYGDYWILDLDQNYEFAVVGEPDRKYLWILSRTAQMDPAVYDAILERLKGQHYDVSKLVRTPQ